MKQVTNRCQHICSCMGFHLYVLFTGQQSVQIITHSLMPICLWMISGEIFSHQLPAFPQTIQALMATHETVKADENEPFWKFPGVWLCSPRLDNFCRLCPALTQLIQLGRAQQLRAAPTLSTRSYCSISPKQASHCKGHMLLHWLVHFIAQLRRNKIQYDFGTENKSYYSDDINVGAAPECDTNFGSYCQP